MNAVAEVLDRLRGYGVELTPVPPNRIRWRAHGPLTDEAKALLAELKERKPEALRILTPRPTDPQPWDAAWEKARLDTAYNWADEEARLRGKSWSSCWSFARHRRPDLMELHDDAIDAINAAQKARDVRRHIEACDLLRQAVAAIVDANAGKP